MKTIYELMGGSYEKQGDYELPTLALPQEKLFEIGVWGQRYRRHLKENVTENLKQQDMMLWVRKMNNIRNRAMEIVNQEVIYV